MVSLEGLLAEVRKYGIDVHLEVSWCNPCQMQCPLGTSGRNLENLNAPPMDVERDLKVPIGVLWILAKATLRFVCFWVRPPSFGFSWWLIGVRLVVGVFVGFVGVMEALERL